MPTSRSSHPGPGGDDVESYWRTGLGAKLEAMYGALLAMQPHYIGYHKLVFEPRRVPEIGFEYSPGDPPPQWPDPDHPQQVHLDVDVSDLDEAERLVVAHGASKLRDNGEHRVFADPVGHPFCLYSGGGGDPAPGRLARIVFDCFSPRSLAAFYEELLDLRTRVVDTPERVEIGGAGTDVILGFQHSTCQSPRWPDPAYPAQLHLDLAFEDESVRSLVERLGAIYLPTPGRPDHVVYADPAGHPFCL